MTAVSHIVIAIDGPSGAGKSSVAKCLAQLLGYCYVDSGALYRAVGWAVQVHTVASDDSDAIVALLERIDLTLCHRQSQVWVEGHNITEQLGGEVVGRAASTVATIPAVRQRVTAKLRRLRCQADLVMEGRDIGTVVFPDATCKFFLDAAVEVRGQRRFQEMQRAGSPVTLERVIQAMTARDTQDRARTVAPLALATEACIIDTTDLIIDEVVEIMLSEIRAKIPQRSV